MNTYQRFYLIFCKSHSKCLTLQQTQKSDKKWNIQTILQFNYSTVSSLKFAGRWEAKIKQETDDSDMLRLYMFIYIGNFEADERR